MPVINVLLDGMVEWEPLALDGESTAAVEVVIAAFDRPQVCAFARVWQPKSDGEDGRCGRRRRTCRLAPASTGGPIGALLDPPRGGWLIGQRTSVGLGCARPVDGGVRVGRADRGAVRARAAPDHGELLGWLRPLPGPVAVTYEPGPTGFGLVRFLAEQEIGCLVAAPSKLQRPAGDRVKTDVRDARNRLGGWPDASWRAEDCVLQRIIVLGNKEPDALGVTSYHVRTTSSATLLLLAGYWS